MGVCPPLPLAAIRFDRGPNKRRIKPVEKHIIDVPIIEDDSEDDKDYQFEDDVQNTSKTIATDSDGSDDNELSPANNGINPINEMHGKSTTNISSAKNIAKSNSFIVRSKPICLICLSNSEDSGEIIECDKCGISVHEGCYGVEDESVLDDDPTETTEPWFCDCCLDDNNARDCELCPNHGGILKQTDTGRWVHLVCALYTAGVAFGDVDKLKPVILSEISSEKWKNRECYICEDQRFAKTGICISCDAGLCKTYFHVTCAQRNGLLLQETSEQEVADPFFAYCKLHCDKELARKQKRNWLASRSLFMQTSPLKKFLEDKRLQKCFERAKEKYSNYRKSLPKPITYTEFEARDLCTSPPACRKLHTKADLMGIAPQSNIIDSAIESIKSVRRRWSIVPSFTCEFVCYYFERKSRVAFLKENINTLKKKQIELLRTESKYLKELESLKAQSKTYEDERQSRMEALKQLLQIVNKISDKPFRLPESLQDSLVAENNKRESKDTKMRCAICGLPDSEYSMALCDTCRKYYHLACLSPPLMKMPRKTAKFGWQCSDCVKSDDSDDEALMITNVNSPRQMRSNRKPTVVFTPQNIWKRPSSDRKRGWPAGKKRKLAINNEKSGNEHLPKVNNITLRKLKILYLDNNQ
ncbi:uncharacterized protein TRIADDRAFT_53785 [Trichoplax adhaerens]|uniref:PHD finger protein 14 n=1 Tax=Trichoplax adhaerens TaxID=10228 RepID=B3RQ58_TRIAD|nr:hypothetical protein TRIADDRAFT_53785 [Trichoplax adhaerens]EDV28296.1 hypothetical protein TRIADDRAFT_53785 [Trichoplax adhaerens]|eukprot:XP_002110130.1 hypothetical protein TRIADDRAFT_53785 [Trichoplax adhaerens]